MHKPRVPNKQEVDALQAILLNDMGPASVPVDSEERTNIRKLIDGASVAISDNYVADSSVNRRPYKGKLMSVVWPIEPQILEVFAWLDGELQSLTHKSCGMR